MKNLFVILISIAFSFYGCKDDAVTSDHCQEALEDYQAVVLTFTGTPNEANCEAWKTAVDHLLDDCDIAAILGDQGISQAEWQEVLDDLAAIDCSTL